MEIPPDSTFIFYFCKNIDKTFIQPKMLNKSKGPAVHSLRAQADKQAYSTEMRKTLENQENLTIKQGEVTELIVEDGKITGYAGLLMIAGEGDVTNIAVFPENRGQGTGSALTEALISEGRKRGMNAFTLEVRVSNQSAIHIYEKLGFRSEGVRKGFYEKPKEDALIMWLRDV